MEGRVFYFGWETALMEWLQTNTGAFGATVAAIFTAFGEEMILVVIFGLLYWCIDKKAARIIGTGLLTALILNPMIKNIVLRRRPYFDNAGIKCLKPVNKKADIYDISAQGYSFPSAHSLDSLVMFGTIARIWKKPVLRVLVVILPLLVGLSRVMLGVHYPTDVLAGWILGILIVVLIPFIQERIKNENIFHLILFLLSATGVFFCRTEDYYTGLGIMAGLFLAIPFEQKFVSFKETRKPHICVLRVVGGIILYECINTVFKLPFSKAFLESGTMPALLVRSVRYMIIIFLLFAIYPMLFGRIQAGKVKHQDSQE